ALGRAFALGRGFGRARLEALEREAGVFFLALGLLDLRDFDELRDFPDDRVRAIRGPPIRESQ
ncbi:MAG TPA: hypothetical protein VFV36_09990, partial [Candidatus Methylomirabilis sp.]|nr:hypothetical protein [Candidatus Methylomirabilis sp.]